MKYKQIPVFICVVISNAETLQAEKLMFSSEQGRDGERERERGGGGGGGRSSERKITKENERHSNREIGIKK